MANPITVLSNVFILFSSTLFNHGFALPLAQGPIIKLDLSAPASHNIWRATGIRGTQKIDVPATVPGGIYSDLDAAGGIYDSPIYYRSNDGDTKWVGRTDWNFTRELQASQEMLDKVNVRLVCEGLDTIATLYVNGVPIGSSSNMFVRYIFNIKSALKLGRNTLKIAFESPVLYAAREAELQNKEYPVPPDCNPQEYHGECHVNHIRKMQASFAWDWGPSYPSSGIWKNIYIEAFNGGVIRDVMIFVKSNRTVPDETAATLWELTTRVWIDYGDQINVTSDPAILTTMLTPKSNGQCMKHILISNQTTQSALAGGNVPTDSIQFIQGDKVKLWWPNGYGEQPLYDLKVTIEIIPGEIHVKHATVGFRTIELIQDPIDPTNKTKGLKFYFNVNGVPIYAKGSNLIPIHVLPERATPEMTQWLFQSSREAHFNMLRIWGGGIYQSEEFYNYADEMGILIWEDFMFACAMYPVGRDFLASVRSEVETQVKRIQSHPSVAIWAANNENEAALRGNWYGTRTNYSRYAADYVQLYIDTILNYVGELDPSRPRLSSSPTNGKESEAEGWIAQNPYSTMYGDVHFYNYQADGWDWRPAPKTRFASEYGFQSWPSPETLEDYTSRELDWKWNSDLMFNRQHHPGGQLEMEEQIRVHLPIPPNPNSTESFEAMLYMAQITQAMSVKTQTEFYRRLKDEILPSGEGHNMGALYWQLNDIWPGASWAGIEYTGRWKMLHYYARNFFAPIIISPYQKDNGDISVHLVSDSMTNFNGALRARLFELDSLTPLFDDKYPVFAEKLSAKEAVLIKASCLDHCKNSVSVCLLHFSMEGAGVPSNFLYLEYPTLASYIQDPKLKVTSIVSIEGDGRAFQLTLETEAIAPFVVLTFKNNSVHGYFSDNGFNLVDRRVNLTFKSEVDLTLDEFQAGLNVQSLHDFL